MVCEIAVHVVRKPNPRVKPKAIDATARSDFVTISGLKSPGRNMIILA